MSDNNVSFRKWISIILVFPAIFALYMLWGMMFSKPVAVIDAATDPNKMLANYEWFHEAADNFVAKQSQIVAHKQLILNEKDKDEVRRLRIELATMQQSCRELSAKYAAKSGEIHVGFLKSGFLPNNLPKEQCE